MLEAAILEEAESVTFTRHAAGTRSKGVYVPGSTSTFSAMCAVQPLTPRELALLPEGERTSAKLGIYGMTQLQIASPDTGRLGDRFTYNSRLWEITGEDDWHQAGAFYHYIATKVEA